MYHLSINHCENENIPKKKKLDGISFTMQTTIQVNVFWKCIAIEIHQISGSRNDTAVNINYVVKYIGRISLWGT